MIEKSMIFVNLYYQTCENKKTVLVNYNPCLCLRVGTLLKKTFKQLLS